MEEAVKITASDLPGISTSRPQTTTEENHTQIDLAERRFQIGGGQEPVGQNQLATFRQRFAIGCVAREMEYMITLTRALL